MLKNENVSQIQELQKKRSIQRDKAERLAIHDSEGNLVSFGDWVIFRTTRNFIT